MKWAWAWAVGGAIGLLASCGGKSESDSGAGGSAGVGGVGGSAGVGSTAGSGGVPQDSGVDVAPPDAPPPPGQNILFEVSFENYAWGKKLKGIFITVDGSVWSYDFFANDAGGMPPARGVPGDRDRDPRPLRASPAQRSGSFCRTCSSSSLGFRAPPAGCSCGRCLAPTRVTSPASAISSTRRPRAIRPSSSGAGVTSRRRTPRRKPTTWLLGWHNTRTSRCPARSTARRAPAPPAPRPRQPAPKASSRAWRGCWSKCVSLDHCLAVTDCSQCPGGTGRRHRCGLERALLAVGLRQHRRLHLPLHPALRGRPRILHQHRSDAGHVRAVSASASRRVAWSASIVRHASAR